MRTAIVTDIHANLPALEAVAAHGADHGVDRWVCLGDTVGYASEPDACCDWVRAQTAFCLLGNHDAATCGRMDLGYYHAAARGALEWTARAMREDNISWLAGLPYKVREGDVEYSHGAPLLPEAYDYIFMTSHAQSLWPVRDRLAEITFLGHAHLPRAYALEPDGVRSVLQDVVQLTPGAQYLVAVGSVGQPRDGDPRACYGIFDDEARTFAYHRVSYDISITAQRLVAAGLEPHFAERLFEGR